MTMVKQGAGQRGKVGNAFLQQEGVPTCLKETGVRLLLGKKIPLCWIISSFQSSSARCCRHMLVAQLQGLLDVTDSQVHFNLGNMTGTVLIPSVDDPCQGSDGGVGASWFCWLLSHVVRMRLLSVNPIRFCVDFKVLMLTYKALNGLGPRYLAERLLPPRSTRITRMSQEVRLRGLMPREAQKERTQNRTFSAVALHLWNNLLWRFVQPLRWVLLRVN